MSQWPVDPEPTWPVYPPLPPPQPVLLLPPHHPQAVTALVLGLLSLVVCPVLGIAAVVVGLGVRRDCDLAPERWGGRGCGTAAFVLGLVTLSIGSLWALVLATISLAAG